jgi:hypothetical protein
MTTITPLRPEDRQRSGRDSASWADPLPANFRSEAFAEDLDAPAQPGAWPLRLLAMSALAWGLGPGLPMR